MFDQLFGNPERNERFAQAQSNHDQVDPREAAEYVGQFMQQAPPEVQQQVLQQYMRQLNPAQRQALAQAMIQHDATPVQDVRVDDDDDMVQAFQRSGQTLSNQRGPAGGLGELFGMFGGMMGGPNPREQQSPMGQQGGFGSGMPGGFSQGQSQGGFGQGMGQQQRQQQNPMGGLGQMLENPMARAGLVSLAAVIGSQLLGANRRR